VTTRNGAHALLTTLVDGGVDVCFANPGTSEMHFVAALDGVPGMRGVLALFEGVATGAADGYARMADKAAAVLLHLGPGLGNGLANLHNARRAHVPMVVVVGDHATYHKKYDAPLESDIDAVAGTVSGWVRRTMRTADVAADVVEAIEASRTGVVSTLIVPADVSWTQRRRCPRSTTTPCARPWRCCVPVSRPSCSSAGTRRARRAWRRRRASRPRPAPAYCARRFPPVSNGAPG
jgi:thiamine pyrophosphate-dependent acetolactate synthase large subunit-like protein